MAVLGWKNINLGHLPDPTEVSETTGRKLGDLTRNWYKGAETWLEIDKRRREEMTAQEAVKINAARDAAELDRVVAAQAQNPVRGANYDSLSQGITDKRSAFTSDAYTRAQEADIHTDNIRDDKKLEAQESLWLRQGAQEDAAARAHAGRAAISEDTLSETQAGRQGADWVQNLQHEKRNRVAQDLDQQYPGLSQQDPEGFQAEVNKLTHRAMGELMANPAEIARRLEGTGISSRHLADTDLDPVRFNELVSRGGSGGSSRSGGTQGGSQTSPQYNNRTIWNPETGNLERLPEGAPDVKPLDSEADLNMAYTDFSNKKYGTPVNISNSLKASGLDGTAFMKEAINLSKSLGLDASVGLAIVDSMFLREKDPEGKDTDKLILNDDGTAKVDPHAGIKMREIYQTISQAKDRFAGSNAAEHYSTALESLGNMGQMLSPGGMTAAEAEQFQKETQKKVNADFEARLKEEEAKITAATSLKEDPTQEMKKDPIQTLKLPMQPSEWQGTSDRTAEWLAGRRAEGGKLAPSQETGMQGMFSTPRRAWGEYTRDMGSQIKEQFMAMDRETKQKLMRELKEKYDFSTSDPRPGNWAKLAEIMYKQQQQPVMDDIVAEIVTPK